MAAASGVNVRESPALSLWSFRVYGLDRRLI